MSSGAQVRSLEAVTDARTVVIRFSEDAKLALIEAEGDMQRTMWWLGERWTHWQVERRKRDQKVQEAKSELYRAQMSSRDERPSCIMERKALQRAEERLAEADLKLANIKRWGPLMERELMLLKAACSGVSAVLEGEVPSVTARLERAVLALEAYVAMRPDASQRAGVGGEEARTPAQANDANAAGGDP